MADETLKCCPFCGEVDDLEFQQTDSTSFVVCTECGASGSMAVDDRSALRLWNIRTEAK